jgi:hypothetical protein
VSWAPGIRESLGSLADVADHMKIPEKTLAEWRSRGIGPRYLRVGRYCALPLGRRDRLAGDPGPRGRELAPAPGLALESGSA